MHRIIIKVCGVRDAIMTEKIATAGANLIGLIFHPFSSRYVNLDQAKEISQAASVAGIQPVGVFVNHSHHEMRYICESADINIVQLHGEKARAQHHFLPREYQRIYAQNITTDGQLKIENGFEYLDPDRDVILIDHEDAGQGKSINWKTFHYDLPFPWILAGGLTSTNVGMALSHLQPNGVDVSSGVEVSLGNKDISLIREFIATTREFYYER